VIPNNCSLRRSEARFRIASPSGSSDLPQATSNGALSGIRTAYGASGTLADGADPINIQGGPTVKAIDTTLELTRTKPKPPCATR